MTEKNKVIIIAIIIVAILAIAYIAYNNLSNYYGPSQQNNDNTNNDDKEPIKAPDFTVYDANGKAVHLSDFFGRPIVLNFWASWCPPCKGEMPHFNKIYNNYGGEITFVMVDLVDGQRETLEKGKEFINNSGYTFPVYYDTSQNAAMSYGIRSIPTTFIINKEGNIVNGFSGAISEETLLKEINTIK